MARLGEDVQGEYGRVYFTRTDLKRLWELVQVAEGLGTVIDAAQARQRLTEALEALREDSVAVQVQEPLT